jgi:hypothetical protein
LNQPSYDPSIHHNQGGKGKVKLLATSSATASGGYSVAHLSLLIRILDLRPYRKCKALASASTYAAQMTFCPSPSRSSAGAALQVPKGVIDDIIRPRESFFILEHPWVFFLGSIMC